MHLLFFLLFWEREHAQLVRYFSSPPPPPPPPPSPQLDHAIIIYHCSRLPHPLFENCLHAPPACLTPLPPPPPPHTHSSLTIKNSPLKGDTLQYNYCYNIGPMTRESKQLLHNTTCCHTCNFQAMLPPSDQLGDAAACLLRL